MPSNPEGLAIALARIADEKKNRTGFLDLGRLGLTEVPEQLFELEHLWGLNWGWAWRDEQGEWHEAASYVAPNEHSDLLLALHRFPGLTFLSVSRTAVADLTPIAGLLSLQSLNCRDTRVADLTPIAGLLSLQSLNCSSTQVADLTPIAGLLSLQSLDCSSTRVDDLTPIAGLLSLRSLACSSTQVSELPNALIWLDSLKSLYLTETQITDIPAEVLSPDPGANCLESLRAHLRDLKEGEERLPDVKVLVLGNGRIGKTQICRRLRGEEFQPDADSTHGIIVKTALLPMPQPAGEEGRLHLWDFGGQDLYHGTHALFMRTRSLFVLVWTPQSENAREHTYGGMTFRNQRLAYWLEYVRHLSGLESPVIIVQNMCDKPADEARHSPVEDKALSDFRFHKELHYSALNNRGYGTLNDALQQAVQWQWDTFGRAKIGKGRLAVKRKLEALRDEDASLPAGQRKYRTLTQEFFHQLCTETGGVSSPALLLDYLHHVGIVFYQKALFDDCIVLDQEWALQAVYAVFQREKCYRQLRDAHGRFTRSLLEALVWGEYSVEEQEIFLSLMSSCGVCFVHRQEDPERGIETEYIAPDLLPGREDIAVDIEAMWGHDAATEGMVVELPFLHPGVMRGIISRIGKAAGISALYWKYGVCLYEGTTRSRALIEQRSSESPTTWSGQILVSTRGGQAIELLGRLKEWIEEELTRAGCRDTKFLEPTPVKSRSGRAKKVGRPRAVEREPDRAVSAPPLKFSAPPSEAITYCVSYAWNDESKTLVDRLCEQAKQHGIAILRDTNGLGLGESITRFMNRLGAGDRVFVILSDKYLKSTYCMYELREIWRNCKMEDQTLRDRIRVYRMADAAMMSPIERVRCAKYWREQFTELDALVREDASLLGRADFERYKLILEFAHHVGDILALIADTLLPKDFDDLIKYGFGDEVTRSPMDQVPFNKEAMAKWYARQHLQTDPGIREIYYLPRGASDREIRFVEVNHLIAERNDHALEPLDFGVDTGDGSEHKLFVLDVTPSQWNAIEKGSLALPGGWTLENAIIFNKKTRR